MSRESERIAIITRFTDNWDDSVCPVKLPNQKFLQPTGGLYGELSIVRGDQLRLTIGKTFLVRAVGAIQLDIYCAPDTGESASNKAEDAFIQLFQEVRVQTIDGEKVQFQQPKTRLYNQKNDKYRICVLIPFYRDLTRSSQD